MIDLEHDDFAPLTQLLDLALEFAGNTWNDAAYHVLVAAGLVAFSDRQTWQVINTAHFLGTNEYFVERLSIAGIDRYPEDFIALAHTLLEQGISFKVAVGEARTDRAAPADRIDVTAIEERIAHEAPALEARRLAALAEALAYRNLRARDDA